ncbi:hypothetical protein GQ53DRAFT_754042 [Thozetella sp. PMI_491]|nr:hypothetical protein GQ53DRAFT_754042 [Thozetella sp. PMI_491]
MARYVFRLAVSFGLLALSRAGVIPRSPIERIYLANCGSSWDISSWTNSQVGYFASNAAFEEDEPPTALYDFGRLVTWEGNTLVAPLPNGDVFTSQISANAGSQPVGAVVGNGTTNTESWVITKRYGGIWGNGGEAWPTDDGKDCIVRYEVSTT